MTQVNFSGSGTDDIESQVGKGQGLQVGTTKIDFASGKIQLDDSKTIGNFRTLRQKGSKSNQVKSFAFKSSTKATIKFQDTFIEYNLINEWITLQGIQTEEISISRIATGLTIDIFDFTFIASDDVNYKVSIEKGTRDSDVETVFASSSRIVATYTQTINIQGAKKLILLGKGTSGTGVATITAEIFDPASKSWIEHIPVEDLFTLTNAQSKFAQVGDTISRFRKKAEIRYVKYLLGVFAPEIKSDIESDVSNIATRFAPISDSAIGYVLPSGDSLFRIKVVIATSALTFSLGVIKVFE